MSWQASEHVRQLRGISTVEKAVLFALADRHNVDDNGCWPRMKLLAEDAGVSLRSAQRSLRALEERGVISITMRKRDDGSATSSFYQFLGLVKVSGGHATLAPPPATVAPLEPSIEPSKEEEDQPKRIIKPSDVFKAAGAGTTNPVFFAVQNPDAYDAAFKGTIEGFDAHEMTEFIKKIEKVRELRYGTGLPLYIPEMGNFRALIVVSHYVASYKRGPQAIIHALEDLWDDISKWWDHYPQYNREVL